ncbi:MAG: hypothetical protein Q9161_006085 [Pseudevernia consocians]
MVKLATKLEEDDFTIVDRLGDQLTAKFIKGFTMIENLIAEIGTHKQTHLRKHWKGRFSGQEFDVEGHQSGNSWTAKLREGYTIEPKEGEELAATLRKDGFKIVNKTMDELETLVKEDCPIINDSADELSAKLVERVVIEAIIRFSIGNHQLDTKFMTLVRLASTRTGLGHAAEYYIAIQLRRYLSQTSTYDTHTSQKLTATYGLDLQMEWVEKRSRILDCMARATKDDNRLIEPLDDFALLAGHQTVKTFQWWRDWVDGWLNAIMCGHKPSTSFLIPHNDFGPDLVFAMRKKIGSKDKIVLCSIQVSTVWLHLRPVFLVDKAAGKLR